MVDDRLPDLTPAPGTVESTELFVGDDVLLKAFALAPGATLEPHEHPDATNVIHVLEGRVTIIMDGDESQITAPGVVVAERGDTHGARNETDSTIVFTAALCPLPG